MGIVLYALMAYGLTAVLSLLVLAIIVGISKLTGKGGPAEDGGEED